MIMQNITALWGKRAYYWRVAAFTALALVLAAQPAWAEDEAAAPPTGAVAQFTRVGIVPLKDEGNLRGGAEDLLSIWQAQLEKRFDEVEFVLADPTELGLPAGPLLLEEAVKVGEYYKVEALLTGTFGGVEITGGNWPNAGSSYPSAKGAMSWRLVECGTGLLITDGVVDFGSPKSYSPRVKDSTELARRVLQDLAREAVAALAKSGALAGTDPPQREGESA